MEEPSVLIVEDDDDTRAMMRFLLRGEGLEVWEAGGGEQVLGLLLDRTPGLIITDLMMPGMGGLELIGRVRRLPGCAGLPILVISGCVEGQLVEAARVGATEVLRKPRDLPGLPETVGWLLGRRRKA